MRREPPRHFLIWDDGRHIPAGVCLLAQLETVGHNVHSGISTRLFQEKDFQGVEREQICNLNRVHLGHEWIGNGDYFL